MNKGTSIRDHSYPKYRSVTNNTHLDINADIEISIKDQNPKRGTRKFINRKKIQTWNPSY